MMISEKKLNKYIMIKRSRAKKYSSTLEKILII